MGETGLYMLISGAIAAFFTFLGPLIGKRMSQRTEAAQEERSNFDTMFQATMKMLDTKDSEINRIRKDCDQEVTRSLEREKSLAEQLERCRARGHEMNQWLNYYTMKYGSIKEIEANENGDPK